MISLEEAIARVLGSADNLLNEQVLLLDSLDRILAKNVFADVDMPPFDKSAMDGYACRRADLTNILEVIEIIPAGAFPQKTIEKNQCAKIMTGAPVPMGADCVIKVEETEIIGDHKISFKGSQTNNNICYRAEDVTKGEAIVLKGTHLQPRHIALLASLGCTHPWVSKLPRVVVFSTGDELVEPDVIPSVSQIRNSNAYQIIAQMQQIGIKANNGGIIRDDVEVTEKTIREALGCYDIIILSGGVSMGDFDFIPSVLKEIGFNQLFDSIAIQPGKPTTFWKTQSTWCFGLPGNPVSSLVQTELLVKPFILKLMGCEKPMPPTFQLPMKKDFSIRKRERKSLIPILIDETGRVVPVEYHGSAHIAALLQAQGLMMVDENTTFISKESLVNVRLI
ncbi:MAG: gephyrin-like molybdotransferase Glp [Bacteroidota bacterium]